MLFEGSALRSLPDWSSRQCCSLCGPSWTLRLHTALEKAVPAVDSTVEEPVSELHLIYTTNVLINLSDVTVAGPGGNELGTGELGYIEGSEEHGLLVPVSSALGVGSYTVSWRTAGPDSHPIRGEYSFTVAAA